MIDGRDGLPVWEHLLGDEMGDGSGVHVVTNDQGRITVLGFFQGRIDFDPSDGNWFLNAGADTHAFVTRFRFDGSLEWAEMIDHNYITSITGLATAEDGGVFVTENIIKEKDLPGNPAKTIGTKNSLLHKVDVNGNLEWTIEFPGVIRAIASDREYGLAVSGGIGCGGSCLFSLGDDSWNLDDGYHGYVALVDEKGDICNSVVFLGHETTDSTRGEIRFEDLAWTPDGNIVSVGRLNGAVEFPGVDRLVQPAEGEYNLSYVVKLNVPH
jgi:hypothetical protein